MDDCCVEMSKYKQPPYKGRLSVDAGEFRQKEQRLSMPTDYCHRNAALSAACLAQIPPKIKINCYSQLFLPKGRGPPIWPFEAS